MMQIQNAAVIGHPIGHTMSPFLQERLFALQNIPLDYHVLDIPDLKTGMEQLRKLDCFNITIPHKSAIIPFLDELDKKAGACGSVNTVRVQNGKMRGTTTDGAGCHKALKCHGLDFSGRILLLGNGGAAKAVAYEAAETNGFQLTIAHRKSSCEKAMGLSEGLAEYARARGDRNFQIKMLSYEELEQGEEEYDLLLNTTSVGMYPNAGTSLVSERVTARCGAVFDAVYNPGETELLKLAAKSGAKTVGGMEMLVYQAVAAHEFWYGSSFRDEDISQLCRDAEKELEKKFGKKGENA